MKQESPIGACKPEVLLLCRIVKQLEGSKGCMWLGGGEVDLKLGFYVADFIRGYKPLLLDCTYDDDSKVTDKPLNTTQD